MRKFIEHFKLRNLKKFIYGRNINEERLNDSSSADMNKTDGENFFQHIKLVLQNFFNRFEREYILVLKERYIYDKKRCSNYDNDLINDIVLIKGDINPRMKWIKAKVVKEIEKKGRKMFSVMNICN